MNSIETRHPLSMLLKRLWLHLSRRRRQQFFMVMGLMLISALAEVVSLGALLPFIGILIEPERVFYYPAFSSLVRGFRLTSAEQLILPLTLAFISAVLVAGSLRMILMWISMRLANAVGSDLSVEVYNRTLYQPYQTHLSRNSSVVVSAIIGKVNRIISELLIPFLVFGSSIVLIISVTIALIAINPVVALVVAGGFGTAYFLITRLFRSKLNQNSRRISFEETQVVKALHEGLGGIRDVLLEGSQPAYCAIYRNADLALRRAQASNRFVSESPRYIMEAVGMILIAVLAYLLSKEPGGVAVALPVLAALALGAQRLLPALQQSYNSWSLITGCKNSLIDILELLNQQLPDDMLQTPPKLLQFNSFIRFDAVSFRYLDNSPLVLDGVNLLIPKGSRVGFVGTTGSGKSTALDLLMGLLTPTKGRLFVDSQHIESRKVRAWQQCIAHVPQNIYLADTTIAKNIAFGEPSHIIDMNRVRHAARQAQIADFIDALPKDYDTFVGERGVRLSGGQRQRIGIARALYKRASVLIFDEATSALDSITEQSVMDAIENLNRELTILMVAHRLTTVRRCDIIIELGDGRVIAQGTYEKLLETSPSFRSLAAFTA